jgi:hypothetical protein
MVGELLSCMQCSGEMLVMEGSRAVVMTHRTQRLVAAGRGSLFHGTFDAIFYHIFQRPAMNLFPGLFSQSSLRQSRHPFKTLMHLNRCMSLRRVHALHRRTHMQAEDSGRGQN